MKAQMTRNSIHKYRLSLSIVKYKPPKTLHGPKIEKMNNILLKMHALSRPYINDILRERLYL